jgi:hypothetical protein
MDWHVESRDPNNPPHGVIKSPTSDTREGALKQACDLMYNQHREVLQVVGPNEVVKLAEIERYCREHPPR